LVKFSTWCSKTDEHVKKTHNLQTLNADAAKLQIAVGAVAKIVPTHYASEERLAGVLRRLGKPKAAAFIEAKLPTSKNIRSGDLGEILAASYVVEMTAYASAINRLRWKDHRNMSMRGDDVIGIRKSSGPHKVEFLKGEVKSSVALTAGIVSRARKALRKDRNRPSPHALAFLADRLLEQKKKDLVDLVDDALLKTGIKLSQVSHLLFTFSGNDATQLLRDDLNSYTGRVKQYGVALIVKGGHQKFIKDVYQQVIKDGGNS
jgi:hypothetical protein